MEENNKKKLTIFQRLGKVLTDEANSPAITIDPASFDNLSGQELQQKELETHQTFYLQNQWKKIDNELYQKAVYYEPTRMASYFDYEAMEYCLHGDTQIVTLDGVITIKELAAKGEEYEFITYAYDHNLKKVVPALARNAHYTRDEMTYKITFDDGKFIIGTWEHKLMKRDGVFAPISELKIGDSMMPFYRKSFYNNNNYNWIYMCNSDEGHHGWISEHNLIAEWFNETKVKENEEVHHIDFNGKNNLPENLKIMLINEHRSYHAKLNNGKLWTNPEYRAKMLEISKRTDNKHHWNGERSGDKNPTYIHLPFDLIIEAAKKEKTLKKTATLLNVSYRKIQKDIVNAGYNDWITFLEAYGIEKSKYSTAKAENETLVLNHKIISIEPYGIEPVYDLTVPGYKNFATDSIFSHNTPEISAALDIFADEATTSSESGKILTIYSESSRIKNELENLFENVLDINTNLTSWARNLPIKEDSIIPLLSGENITIKEVTERLKNNEELFTYAVQDKTLNIVPGKIVWADRTRINEDIIRIIFDDETFIETTYDHEIMLRDGTFKRADKLLENDSLMPFYTKISDKKDSIQGYEKIYNPSSNYFKFTHSIVSKENLNINEEKNSHDIIQTHHKNFNKLNNNPNNLIRMSKTEHFKLHSDIAFKLLHEREDVVEKRMKGIDKYLRSDKRKKRLSKEMKGIYPKYFEIYNISELHNEHNSIRSKKMKKLWNNDSYKQNVIQQMTLKLGVTSARYLENLIISNDFLTLQSLSIILKNDNIFVELFKNDNKHFNKDISKSLNTTTIVKLIKRLYNQSYYEFVLSKKPELINERRFNGAMNRSNSKLKNHKILRIEFLKEKSDVYCLEINGLNGEKDRHNFPVCSKNNENEFTRNGIFVANCKYGDNFVYNKIAPKKGIVGVMQLPNIELTRTEPGFTQVRTFDDFQDENVTKFHWKDKNISFNSFEISHFRLLFDDRKLPYGTSMLEKVRRIWKQLLLAEDAMLVYRVTRAPERRVYKIFVGNMDDKDVDAYVDKIANNFKRVNTVQSNNGQQDTRFNAMSVDQDYFIPVRDPSLTMPIETLPGATNLSEIEDIEYIQKKMLAALRVPKAFLGFDEATGDGKNLAILDIRFARAVHRIQKALIQELNKMAIIHLYLKGYEDDLNNFTLSLTSPSTQADILKVQNWKEKIQLYRDVVSDAGNGFGAMSMTRAQKEFLNMSDDDIKLDVQRQAVEKAAKQEMLLLGETIKQTGMFREIYKSYKINPDNMATPGEGVAGQEEPVTTGGGGGGGGLATDFTSPLETSDPNGENQPPLETDIPEEQLNPDEEEEQIPLRESLSDTVKRNMGKRRKHINETINNALKDIDKMLNETL